MVNVKTIVYASLAAVLTILLIVGLVLSHRVEIYPTCNEIEVSIQTGDESAYLNRDEVVQWLMRADQYPVGKAVRKIDTHGMEQHLQQHPMVRQAECYLLQSGVCRVKIEQRTPIYRVTTAVESYLVDSDRKRMPLRSSMPPHWLTAEGNIGERMATNELYDLMTFLSTDRYWHPLVARVEVRSPQMCLVILKDGRRVILGAAAGYETKLDRLQKMWDATAEYPDARAKEYDLRYDRQVITRNK